MIGLMQDSIVDVTASVKAIKINNLQALNIDFSGNYSREPFDSTDIKAFNSMIRVFGLLSPQAKKLFAI